MNPRRLVRDILLNRIISSVLMPRALRWRVLRMVGMDIEGWCAVMPDGWYGGIDLAIGADTTINYGVFFDTSAPVSIGRRCDIGMEVMFCTGTHAKGRSERRAGESESSPIVVRDGVWIGTRAIVLPGVTIGEGCIIAAGSVVANNCAPNGTYAGVPARRIADLAE